MNITDEIRSFVNNLYDMGYRGNSNSYKGVPPADEDHLTGLIIQSTPYQMLPDIEDLDPSQTLWGMLSRYLKHSSPELAEDIAEHLKASLVKHFQPHIQRLMDDAHDNSTHGERESADAKTELRRDLAAFDRQRI